MKKPPSKFRFKQFAVSHHRSAMKVGVDGVLVGCWADVASARRILDVGAGCGLISLIMAQRCPDASVTGVEVDPPSVEEALSNVAESPWSDRLDILCRSFPDPYIQEAMAGERFDLVVSNPPYFDSGVSEVSTPREAARHQGVLSPSVILDEARKILRPGGEVALVVPAEIVDRLEREAASFGYSLRRRCRVRGHSGAPWKRTLLQWRFRGESVVDAVDELLTLELSPGVPTEEYRALCRDFYLKF